MRRALTIGRLATAAGVNVETIRYYQRRGLLDQPPKPLGGYRHYPAAMAERIRFIKRAQSLGFKLEEILTLPRFEGADCCAQTRRLAAQRLADIEQKLTNLRAMRDALAELVRQCDAGQMEGPCPIICGLAQDD
ncbi:MerR family transcriptional regulator [Methylocapsa polymorpha]|uniref:Mercuric resistance operon regulatory protein n=1 Tax=Methylocapsa polymorpha TaxID=3080828 RepID=A0ABZ0HLS5_9HYPH|nr:MerR family transcriptional regulator [Methylocapsa sp. RX1]